MQAKLYIKALIVFAVSSFGDLTAQNCKLDLTPVTPDVLVSNKVKEIKVHKTDVSGNKLNYQHFYIDENGGCNKQLFYIDPTKSNDPVVSECIFEKKTNCSIFSKHIKMNGVDKSLLRDEEYYDDNGKLIKKITVEGDEIIQKTIHTFDSKNSANEDKRFYKIHVKENDTLTKVINTKTAKKHLYYLINKTASGYDTERSETVFDTPTSGSVKVYRNDKLVNQYEFGKDKKQKNLDTEEIAYGLPHAETAFKKVYTNDDKIFAPAKDIENCKYMVMVKRGTNDVTTSLVYDKKTLLLLKEVNSQNGKNIEGKEYEYVK
ncbi:MAG: hypothetical protein SGJ15_11715 [Bacteroidota bacterium]|nr:hypothetical protein [Bacteroidota bacterium]